jgi:M-phase phosphoprotein-6
MTPICNETKDFNIDSSESISLSELKRKEPELERETPPS